MIRLLLLSLPLIASLALADTAAVQKAAALAETRAVNAPALTPDFRLLAAEALHQRHPDLARRFVEATVEQLKTSNGPVSPSLIVALAGVAPADAVAIVPKLSPRSVPTLISALARGGHLPEATKLFRDTLASAHLDNPDDAWSLVSTCNSLAAAAPALAADGYEAVLKAVSAPDYAAKSDRTISGTFQVAGAQVATSSTRDTLLLAAGSRLHAVAPDRAAQFQSVLVKWDLSRPVAMRGINLGNSSPSAAAPSPSLVAAQTEISKGISSMRGLATDAERAKLVLDLTAKIRALPAGKLSWASSISNLATEGDLGKEALSAVASTLALALHETPGSASNYIELAKLVRYEHVPAPPADPALDAATAILQLRDEVLQDAGFSLSGIDGKTYNLDSLRGKVVLVNFWATWCPPCRKEMPDMEKLYQRFSKDGLVVLAISDEDRDTVVNFLKKQSYTFPVLLDPDRKVNTIFAVEGIPKSFLFDRQGKLAAQAIDMRTESQFLEMFKSAGLK